jgi:hypothetical protein
VKVTLGEELRRLITPLCVVFNLLVRHFGADFDPYFNNFAEPEFGGSSLNKTKNK